MKITAIQTFSGWAPLNNWYFVRVETDEGHVGWGEGSLRGPLGAVDALISEVSSLLIGHEFEGIEVTWQKIYHAWRWRGGAVHNTGLAALDLAFWDLEGKHLGVPVYRLLGGAMRQNIPAYSSYHFTPSADEFGREAQAVKDAGYEGIKWEGLHRIWNNRDVPSSIAQVAEIIAAARSAVGPQFNIYLEATECLTQETARRLCRAIEPSNVGFIEEPLPFENPKALIQLSQQVSIPIATGERLLSRWEFREVIEGGAAVVIQPDLMHAMGLTEVRKIANAADTYYLSVAPHGPSGPISTAAVVHLGMAIPNFLTMETNASYRDERQSLRDEITIDPFRFDLGGVYAAPDRPGFGVELDVERLRDMKYRPMPPGLAPKLWLQ